MGRMDRLATRTGWFLGRDPGLGLPARVQLCVGNGQGQPTGPPHHSVLSPNYLQSLYTKPEWAVAFRRNPTGEQGLLLPVRIQKCDIKGLLGPIVYLDLVGLDEIAAQEKLLKHKLQTHES
jgi:hypothetical protein